MDEPIRSERSLADEALLRGSARFDENHRYYRLARDLGRELAGLGYTVITGGGSLGFVLMPGGYGTLALTRCSRAP